MITDLYWYLGALLHVSAYSHVHLFSQTVLSLLPSTRLMDLKSYSEVEPGISPSYGLLTQSAVER